MTSALNKTSTLKRLAIDAEAVAIRHFGMSKLKVNSPAQLLHIIFGK